MKGSFVKSWDSFCEMILPFGLLVLLVPFSGLLSELQMISFAALTCCLLFSQFRSSTKVGISKFWLCFILFSLWSLSSYFWATNGSLVLEEAGMWILMTLFGVSLSSFLETKDRGTNIILKLEIAFSYLAIIWLAYFFLQATLDYLNIDFLELPLRMNNNKSFAFVGMFLPFFIKRNNKNIVAVLSVLLCYFLLFVIFKAKGALIGIGIVICLFYFKRRLSYFIVMLGLIGIIGIMILIDNDVRLLLFKLSFERLLLSPLFGVGLGNWPLEVFNASISEVTLYNNPNYFFRGQSHNFYTKILVELGIVGFSLFVGLLYFVGDNLFQKESYIAHFKNPYLSGLIYFLVLSMFYNFVSTSSRDFSQFQLMFVLCFVVLIRGDKIVFKLTKSLSGVFLVTVLIVGGGFIGNAWANNRFYTAKKLEVSDPIKALSILENIYDANYKTNINWKESLPMKMLDLSIGMGNSGKVDLYFSELQKLDPSNLLVIEKYVRFQLKQSNFEENLESLLLSSYKRQPNRYRTNFLLAEWYLHYDKLELSRKHLMENIDSPYRGRFARILKGIEAREARSK